MTEDAASALRGVEKTMLLPLWGRYSESIREHGLLHDSECLRLVEYLGIDFSVISSEQLSMSRLAWVARALNVVRELRSITEKGGDLTVLNLGCGLDTAFHGFVSDSVRWYDIDFPGVIALKKRLFPESDRYRLIPGSVLEESTYRRIEIQGRPVVLAVGLLYYFNADEVAQLLEIIARRIGQAAMILEYCSARGLEMGNRLVLKNSSDSVMKWSIESADELYTLSKAVRGVESYPLFQHVIPLLNGEEARQAELSDRLAIMSFAKLLLKRI
ncbi:class I SAM-dependent methyltransferase [Marispirochaeta aestuarii]|uniref:class I SAM-dependent methyltransferase n=1 Tax=Marispirochaeta aestuarii TaxID=1963862 RepID=UPI0029C7AF9E|nr:class I SAM-dependent methyltransferase [Marispirochaeta aestuarii]